MYFPGVVELGGGESAGRLVVQFSLVQFRRRRQMERKCCLLWGPAPEDDVGPEA